MVFSILTLLPFSDWRNFLSILARNLDDNPGKKWYNYCYNLDILKCCLTFAGNVIIILLPGQLHQRRELGEGLEIVPGIWGVSA